MTITVNLTPEQMRRLDSMVRYYKKHMPNKISTRETVIGACIMKVWDDAVTGKTKEA